MDPNGIIKLIVWDLDDTLIYAENDSSAGDAPLKFSVVSEDRVVDGPNKVQVLIPGVRELLSHLASLGITMTLGSMGPEWQMRRFLDGFGISHFFDWEIGSYDRRDKGEKVELCIDHYNSRLLSKYHFGDPHLQSERIENENVLFVDDNLGYLGRVDTYLPGIKVLWACFRAEGGITNFYRALSDEFEINLSP